MALTLKGIKRVIWDLADGLLNRRARLGARAFVEGLRADVRTAFRSGVDPVTGTPWQPLKYRQGQILVRSGRLRDAAVRSADAADPSGWGVTVTLADPGYGKFHQYGTKSLPVRRFFGVSPATLAQVRKNAAEDIVKLMVARN